jgi:hypothetical protein
MTNSKFAVWLCNVFGFYSVLRSKYLEGILSLEGI